MKRSIKRLLCLVMVLALLFGNARSTVAYAASGSTTTSTKASTTTKTTTTTKTLAKVKVGEKTWKTQKIVKQYTRNGKKIYGEIYRPVGEGLFPAVVIGHGLNSSCAWAREFAKTLASKGVVAYIFDFTGGSSFVKSDGSTTEMSVLTEAADFNVAFNGTRSLSYVDESRMFVMGDSMGGYIATYIAGTRPNDVKGLITLYPAYNLGGDYTAMLKAGLIPSKVYFLGMMLGRVFFEDLTKAGDIYTTMAKFKGKAVIIHGTNDALVPISYSEKAVKTMKNAKLVKVQGAGHGFGMNSTATTEALNLIKAVANK